MKNVEKTVKFAEKRWKLLLLLAVTAYLVVISTACLVKYWLLGYNALDLAIYSQVFWNSVHGDLFVQSIHPHSYLGDHAEFAIVLLLPFYAAWKDPRALLIMQTAALSLAAVPLFLIVRSRFEAVKLGGKSTPYALLVALAWLLCPAVQNANLFEFHLLAFAPLPLFFALLEYDRGRPRRFMVWCLLALLVREDVALAVFGIGLLAWIERRGWFWKLAPLGLAASWFLGAMAVISHFAPVGRYKYLIYYSWLGNEPLGMLAFPFRHPLRFLEHFATLGNLEMLLGLLMPVAFLPLVKPKWLAAAILPFLQVIMAGPGGSAIVVETHYATLLLPAVFLAAADGLAAAAKRGGDYWKLAPALLMLTAVWSASTFGPMPGAAASAFKKTNRLEAKAAHEALKLVPRGEPVAASYALMPALSSREKLYGLHYACLGLTQFGEREYALPDDARWLAFDSRDILTYRAQFPISSWAKGRYGSCVSRLADLGGYPIGSAGAFTVYDRSSAPKTPRNPSGGTVAVFPGGIRLVSSTVAIAYGKDGSPVLSVAALWSTPPDLRPDDYAVELTLADERDRPIIEMTLPMKTFLDKKWPTGDGPWLMSLDMPAESLKTGTYRPTFMVRTAGAGLTLDGQRSATVNWSASRTVGSIELQPIDIE
jgi:uncharacterized membrane protein